MIAEHRHPTSSRPERRENPQRHGRRVGIRVVRIVDECHPVDTVDHVHPTGGDRPQVRERRADRRHRHPVRPRHRRRRQGVADLVTTGQAQHHADAPLRGDEVESGSTVFIEANVFGAHHGVDRLTDKHDLGGGLRGHRAYPVIVGVEHGEAGRWQRGDQLGLGLRRSRRPSRTRRCARPRRW